jgi:hypothetical protein
MEATLGGYMAQHGRAAAFGGSDGHAYSVGFYVDDEPDQRGRFGAALLFVRWDAAGAAPSATSRPSSVGRTGGQRNGSALSV